MPARIAPCSLRKLRRVTSWAALALAIVQILSIAISSAILIGGSGFTFRDVATADFFFLGILLSVSAMMLCLLMRASSRKALIACAPFALLILAASVGMSHAAARLDHRWLLLGLTALHHLGTAAWIGAMPFLLISLRQERDQVTAAQYTRRFSATAIASVSLLVLGGIGMAVFYIGSWQGVYGTTYGFMMLAKIYLLLLILAMGAGNFFLVKQIERAPAPLLVRLRRFAEAEVGLGFTAILTAASLTSQPPAADLATGRVPLAEIAARMAPRWPRLLPPAVRDMVPPSATAAAAGGAALESFVPGQLPEPQTAGE